MYNAVHRLDNANHNRIHQGAPSSSSKKKTDADGVHRRASTVMEAQIEVEELRKLLSQSQAKNADLAAELPASVPVPRAEIPPGIADAAAAPPAAAPAAAPAAEDAPPPAKRARSEGPDGAAPDDAEAFAARLCDAGDAAFESDNPDMPCRCAVQVLKSPALCTAKSGKGRCKTWDMREAASDDASGFSPAPGNSKATRPRRSP